MTVYVDKPIHRYAGMLMCHMVADTEEELHQMAERIGIDRQWYQGDHYDICRTKRSAAIQHGAKEVRPRDILFQIWINQGRRAVYVVSVKSGHGNGHAVAPLNRLPSKKAAFVRTICGHEFAREDYCDPKIYPEWYFQTAWPSCSKCVEAIVEMNRQKGY